MNSGACYAAPNAGSVGLNYAAVNGIAPGVVIAELGFAPLGTYNMAQLAGDLTLEIKSAFDHEGKAFDWPEPFTPTSRIFLPVVLR